MIKKIKMTIRKILTGAGLIASLAFVGCNDFPISINQEVDEIMDAVVTSQVISWEKDCDKYLEVHSLLEEGKYGEAENLLEEYLANETRYGVEILESIDTSTLVRYKIKLRIEEQIEENRKALD